MATQFFKHDSKFLGKVKVENAIEDDEAVNKGQLDAAISGNTLQQVTDNSNITDNTIIIDNNYLSLSPMNTIQPYPSGVYSKLWYGVNNIDEELSIYWNFVRGDSNEHIQSFEFSDNKDHIYIFPTMPEGTNESEIIVEATLIEKLKTLPSYNASTPQVLGHDASGNVQWQAP